MSDDHAYIEILARVMSEASKDQWDALNEQVRESFRVDAREALTLFNGAGFVIMPKHATEEILQSLYNFRNWDAGPSRLYAKIIEAGQK
jgi:hypothetical protein